MRKLAILPSVLLLTPIVWAVDDTDPEPPQPGPVSLRVVAKKTTYKLDMAGLSPEEYRKAIANHTVKAPPVDLELVVTNNTKSEIRVKTRGSKVNQWLVWHSLKLTGPGVVDGGPYWTDKRDHPSEAYVSVKPRGKAVIPLPTLTSHMASVQVRDHFWTKPGKYTLTASFHTTIYFDSVTEQKHPGTPKELTLKAPPITLTVEE
jgi:hypothetical protein